MTYSGENTVPPSALDLAIDLRDAIDECDTERYPNGCMADIFRMADRLVIALTPPAHPPRTEDEIAASIAGIPWGD